MISRVFLACNHHLARHNNPSYAEQHQNDKMTTKNLFYLIIVAVVISLGGMYIFRDDGLSPRPVPVSQTKNRATGNSDPGGGASSVVVDITPEQPIIEESVTFNAQANTSDEMVELQQQVELLAQELQALREELQEKSETQVSNATALQELAELGSQPEFLEKFEKFQIGESEKRSREISRVFEAEVVDPFWSLQASTAVESAFSNPKLEGGSLVSLDCRSTLCRMEIEYTPPTEGENADPFFFENELIADIASELPSASISSTMDANGRIRYEIVAAGVGQQLPEAPDRINLDGMSIEALRELYYQY